MAPRISLLLSLVPVLSLLSTTTARPGHPFHPCNTFIIATYSVSLRPQNHHLNNPNLIAIISSSSTTSSPFLRHRLFLDRPHHHLQQQQQQQQQQPSLIGLSSFKDRTKDILSVVVSLLFGAACGALTAGTMYLIWSLFNHHNPHASYHSSSDDDDDYNNDDDIFNPKKNHGGYVPIPAADVAIKPVPAPIPAAAPANESA